MPVSVRLYLVYTESSSRQLVLERRTALILYDATLGRVGGNKVRSLLFMLLPD